MGPRSVAALRDATRELLDGRRPARSLPNEVERLVSLLREHAPPLEEGERGMRTAGGAALAPIQSAACAEDPVRTAVFLRGLHEAIGDARRERPDRPTRVLYAGCGAYAVLAVPLLTTYSAGEIELTLLDVHAASIDSARAVVEGVGLSAHPIEYAVADACRYPIPPGREPDVIVTETMLAGLEREPQVSISRELLRQAPDAVLVPESVRVDAVLVDTSEPLERAHRARLGAVFELSRASVRAWGDGEEGRLPGQPIRLPRTLGANDHPMLFTVVRVYGDHLLGPFESGLTSPRRLPLERPVVPGETIECHYRLGPDPGLVFGA